MKIIISPSKTQTISDSSLFEPKDLLYKKEHKKILSVLRKLSKSDIKSIMKIDNDLLDQTYYNIKNYHKNEPIQAMMAFNGLVFKGLDIKNYQKDQLDYMEKHVRILDAFYGVLEPGTMIKPYRLDMMMKIGLPLYKHWNISSYFEGQTVINLASDEFSKLVQNQDMIQIKFLQYKNHKYINQATYSKQGRGVLLNYMIQRQITDIEEIKNFDLDQYTYNESLSDSHTIVFTR